jgi:hypothetical protein
MRPSPRIASPRGSFPSKLGDRESSFPESASQSRRVRSRGLKTPSLPNIASPDSRYLPSGVKANPAEKPLAIEVWWSVIVRTIRPVRRSHNDKDKLFDVASSFPPGTNAARWAPCGRHRTVPIRAIAPGGSGSPYRSTPVMVGGAAACSRGTSNRTTSTITTRARAIMRALAGDADGFGRMMRDASTTGRCTPRIAN